jgi:hypothetical protein
MADKRPIDIKRERGGQAEIGSEQDGAILEMYNLDDRLIVIKEHSLYEFFTADTIDPDRINIDLPPNIQKPIVDEGSSSELVSATFLTAKTLFKPEYLPGLDVTKAVRLSIDLLIELKTLQKEINDYTRKEKEVSDEYENRRNKPHSYTLPAIGNAEARCTTVFQKADKSEQILIEIIMLFYPSDGLNINSHFPDFHEILVSKYGEQDPFSKFIGQTIGFMNVIRELRNGLDHRLPYAVITDFQLQPDSSVLSPTIELKTIRKTQLPRQSLSSFLPVVMQNFILITEIAFAYLAGKNAKPMLPAVVKLIPEEARRFKFMKYAFWSNLVGSGWFFQ